MSEVVYFVKRRNLVKIGTTGDLGLRLTNLNLGSNSVAGMSAEPVEVLAVMPGGRAVEQALHQLFVSLRYDKEWFFYEPPLVDFVNALVAAVAARDAYRSRAGVLPVRAAEARVTLREAVDRGIAPWQYWATKKRLQRARRTTGSAAPVPVGRDGNADVYLVGDLIVWIEAEMGLAASAEADR